MSDMRHVYNAYAAVHNPEIKKNLEESRDAFSKMNLNQLMDQDLYEASEEILEKVFFQHDLDIPTAESLIEAILSDALEGDKSPIRTEKIERISEAFASAFDRIKEKSIRVAKESYTDYLYKKDQLSRITSNSNLDLPKQRLHTSLVAEDKRVVRDSLLAIIEGKINAGLQAYLDKKKGKKSSKDHDEKNGKHDNGNGDKKSGKGGGKPDFLDLDKDGDKKEPMKKAAKEKKLKEGMATPESGTGKYYREGKPTAKQLEVRKQQEKNREASNRGRMAEDLLASGVFSEHEVTKLIWNEFDTEIEENYGAMRNPEKYEREQDKKLERDKPYHKRSRAARMADPERGINSPAFKKFMADRGM